MAFWLARKREGQARAGSPRVDPRFWTVNFPRPMVATVISTAPDALRVDASFLRKADLGGLIWDSEDSFDHPLLAYHTDRDYAHTTLSFRWRSGGIVPLDADHGPTLTIEGRDEQGTPRTWYVRLWNYAQGSPEDAGIMLRFSDLESGFAHPGEPIWPGDIDRMFISFAPPGYDGSADPLDAEVEGWIEMSRIVVDGAGAMLEIGDVMVPPHGLTIATGYDDQGVQTPARLLRNIRQLGYRGSVIHYVGMSHYFRLVAAAGNYLIGGSADPLNTPSRAWHRAFFAECMRLGFSPVASLSYELLDQHCPETWKQRDYLGRPALTGWEPPSTLLSPARREAMDWLQSVGAEFALLMTEAEAPVRFQVGEPWWWTFPDGRICLYDEAAAVAFGGAPPAIADMRAPLDAAQKVLLDAAGAMLAQSTADLVSAVRAAVSPAPVEALALVFTPTLLDPTMPELKRANLPVGWAAPAFDRLQVEDYDWLTAGAHGWRRKAYAEVNSRLGYPPEEQDYLAGFVLNASQAESWRLIDAGIDEAFQRRPHEIVVWALPQIARDGFVRLPSPLAPGAIVTAPGVGGRWRVLEWEWRQSGIELLLERVAPVGADTPPALAADTGRASLAKDLPPARTALVAFELPLDSSAGGNSEVARLCAAVSANSANWSGAALYADRGDGQLMPLGPSGRTRCTIGTTLTAPGPASALLFDRKSEVLVRLVDAAMELTSASARQLAFGANLALVGEEIMQFASAMRLDGDVWRLSGLVRGRGGTESAISTHAAGESFVLLDNRLVSLDASVVGADGARIVAIGRGDEEPVETPVLLAGITRRPLAPVHPRRTKLADGTMRLEWTRRARGDWMWRDGIDVPLVEQSESYLVTLGPLDAPLAMWATTAPVLEIGASLLAELTASASGQPIRARQQGTHALSPPLLLCTLP